MTERSGEPRERVTASRRVDWPVVFPLVVALATAAPSLGFGFTADDYSLLRYVRSVSPLRFFADDFSGHLIFESSYYRPLLPLLLQGEHHLWGLWPLGYHLVNVGLYLLGVALGVLLLRNLGVNPLGQMVGGITFAALPAHVASVGWIADGSDLLTGIGIAAAALAAGRAGRRPGRVWSVGAGLALLGAALAKETGLLAIPIGACAYLANVRERSRVASRSSSPDPGGSLARHLPIVVAATLTLVVYAGLRGLAGLSDPLVAPRFAHGVSTYATNLAYLIAVGVGAPDGTAGFDQPAWLLVSLAALSLVGIVVERGRPRGAAVTLALVWLASALAFHAVTAAPWLAYVPSFGLALLLGAAWQRPGSDRLRAAATGAYLALGLVLGLGWSLRWAHAHALAEQTLATIRREGVEGFLLNVPFDYVDVPVFPNGLEDAVALFEGPVVHPVLYYAGQTSTGQAVVQERSGAIFAFAPPGDDVRGSLVVGHDRYVRSEADARALVGLGLAPSSDGPRAGVTVACTVGNVWVLDGGRLIPCGPPGPRSAEGWRDGGGGG